MSAIGDASRRRLGHGGPSVGGSSSTASTASVCGRSAVLLLHHPRLWWLSAGFALQTDR